MFCNTVVLGAQRLAVELHGFLAAPLKEQIGFDVHDLLRQFLTTARDRWRRGADRLALQWRSSPTTW